MLGYKQCNGTERSYFGKKKRKKHQRNNRPTKTKPETNKQTKSQTQQRVINFSTVKSYGLVLKKM